MNATVKVDKNCRVIQNGNNVNDTTMSAGEERTFTSVTTLELRELGVDAGVSAPKSGE